MAAAAATTAAKSSRLSAGHESAATRESDAAGGRGVVSDVVSDLGDDFEVGPVTQELIDAARLTSCSEFCHCSCGFSRS